MAEMVNPAARRLLDFRRVSDFTFSWPMALLGAAIVLVIGILVAWGVSALERRNRDEARAERIQTIVGHAIARQLGLTQGAILPVVGFPAEGRPTLELTGSVTSEEARRRAVRIAERELARVRPGMEVVDRLEILPAAVDRRRA
jgi:hypothetical protein